MSKNSIKNVMTIAVAGVMIFSLAAYGGTKSTEGAIGTATNVAQEVSEDSLGSWELNTGALSISSNKAAMAAFEKATQGIYGYEYEAIALLGMQVVAGTNYSILARGSAVLPDAQPEYEIINVYEDPEGNAEITASKTIIGGDEEEICGGFTANDGEYDLDKNADVKEAIDKAFENIIGSDYEAVAYIGKQDVQGTNYLVLMRETPVVPDAESEFVLVTVYKDLEGSAEILDIENVSVDAADEREVEVLGSESVLASKPLKF